jgi:UDPglucose 6-dehydrogenase
MNVTVLGLWHLGSVTAACCAKHFEVVGLDFNAATVSQLNAGQAPLLEPGLNELIASGLASKKLSFTTDPKIACAKVDVLWLAYDTPVNDSDESDVESVLAPLRKTLPHLPKGTLVLVSAQLPVGTCAGLEKEYPQFHFASSPENLRLGRAIGSFEKAERAIVGIRTDAKKPLLEQLFKPFSDSSNDVSWLVGINDTPARMRRPSRRSSLRSPLRALSSATPSRALLWLAM